MGACTGLPCNDLEVRHVDSEYFHCDDVFMRCLTVGRFGVRHSWEYCQAEAVYQV